MRRGSLFLLFIILLICSVGCSAGGRTDVTDATAAPSDTALPPTPEPTAAPTPEPTPITIGGSSVHDGVLQAIVTAEDFAQIGQIPGLRVLDVSGSVCYDAILDYRNAHPEVEVRYTVSIGDACIPNTADAAVIAAADDASLFRYLPDLKTVTVTEPMTPAQAKALLDALPDAELTYAVSFAGLVVQSGETALDLSACAPELAEELAEGVSALPDLTNVQLNHPNGKTDWTLEQAGILQAVRPSLRVDFRVKAFGVSFSLTDDVVSFSKKNLKGKTEELRALLPYLRNVRRLDMEDCGIPNAEMAQLREQFPTPKIVWRVRVGHYFCRTDAVMIHFAYAAPSSAIKDSETEGLIYCREVKYLDLGHNLIQNPYFVAYMPDLEVCIIAVGQPTDISAFANCPHLEYAELFGGSVSDVSALANCKELKHLNLAMNEITDITPLYGLTGLERLWISENPIPQEQIDRFRELVPNCVVDSTSKDPTLNAWRYDPDRPGGLSERYELLRKQLCYSRGLTYSIEEPDVD